MAPKKTNSSKSSKHHSIQKEEEETNEYFKVISEDDLKKKTNEIQKLINKTKQDQLNNLPKSVQLQPNSKHKCVQCSQYLYTELIQTRSGDEASTLFCYCCNPDCPMFEKQTRSFK